ncbi:cytochrome-c peroxidase [Methylococcus capsulatus]|uniref:cytochrome-c peroxidase n=1 Tax=Methylococcus capsulatus TaxID=414 RepID=UPI001C533F90|nr:cytochrome c peroxidase [Methylococcus capsulatus]QXP87577.1 c-type cytochrome [Methylococcus capsulatus]QXP92683.1 c-type cytochrome [Methylococcus capsulatus]UQN12592.1 c-type cytochrome [Methylococcus capsulatus]
MRFMKISSHFVVFVLAAVAGALEGHAATALTPGELLGKALFFDPGLSTPPGQSCADCHDPKAGWTGSDQDINLHGGVYEGAVATRFGNRKPPTAAYASFSPKLHRDGNGEFVGGNFWDGRATGERLGNPAADQAQGPFLNPLEQNDPSAADVCRKVAASGFAAQLTGSSYPDLFARAFGPGTLDCDNSSDTYDRIALAIAAYEASREVSSFSSKYDAYLRGRAVLTKQEKKGMALFEGKAKCANCHSTRGMSYAGKFPLFTDFTYVNTGVPRNPENPFYQMPAEFNPLGADWVDPGLGGFLAGRVEYAPYAADNKGKQKVPTLRNVDKRPSLAYLKAYMHNGAFKSLKEVVHFYNTRDVLAACEHLSHPEPGINCWPAAEEAANVNRTETGDLKLSDEEEDAIVAFLRTLSDGFQLSGPTAD